MSRAMDTSLTLIDPVQHGAIDVHVFADADRHFQIRSQRVGNALRGVAQREAPRRSLRVGGVKPEEVEFYELDLRRDKTLNRDIQRVLTDAFFDTSHEVVRTALDGAGLLDVDATPRLDAVAEVIELRRFIANALARTGPNRKAKLLFYFAAGQAAE